MRFLKSTVAPTLPKFEPELRVIRFIATKKGDAERGPMLWLSPRDAKIRMLADGELAWIHGPRIQKQLAPVVIDETIPPDACVVRDIVSLALSESVTVTKPDLDTPKRGVAV